MFQSSQKHEIITVGSREAKNMKKYYRFQGSQEHELITVGSRSARNMKKLP